jgi:predicted PolB exonuclease-like 3'-5' exonuclease
MARAIGKLTALKVGRELPPGRYPDGGGLYLQVSPAKTKSWFFRFQSHGKRREMGLGSLSAVSLTDARVKAAECRRLRHEDVDPIKARDDRRQQAALDAAKTTTFKEAAASYIASHKPGWRNAKHVAQWENTLATYAEPILGKLSIQAIDTDLVLKVLQPIWHAKPETAGRVRGRIEAILDWAKVRGLRQGENPARWRGHLSHLLPARAKVRRVEHHAALPYGELAAFMAALREQEGVAARALEFTILTAARTGETIGAVRGEVDTSVWTVPADRMKAHKEHRVPLSPRALAILRDNDAARSDYLFPGGKASKPLSNMAMTEVLRRYDIREAMGDKFPKHIYHSIICIGALIAHRDNEHWVIDALGAPHVGNRSERELITSFVNIAELSPQLVTFNGSSFDLPVLRYRAMRHKVSAPGLSSRPYFRRYTDDAIDLCDVLSSFASQGKATPHEVCRIMGLPGKPDGMSGAEVEKYYRDGHISQIAEYCESDVVNTYQLWLRHELFRGTLTEVGFQASEANLREFIKARGNTKPHLAELVS